MEGDNRLKEAELYKDLGAIKATTKQIHITGHRNLFNLIPEEKAVIVYGDQDFHAFIQRAPQTERLYESFLQEG